MGEGDGRPKKKDQWMIGDVVEELAKEEFIQREKEGGDENFKKMSDMQGGREPNSALQSHWPHRTERLRG